MIKVTGLKKDRRTVTSAEIPAGSVFTGSVGIDDGLFCCVKHYEDKKLIFPIDSSSSTLGGPEGGNSWIGDSTPVKNYCPVDIEIIIK